MKNTQKIFSLIFCLFIILSVPVVSFAEGSDSLVVDDAVILTFDEKSELEKALMIASEENQASIAVLTTNDFEGKSVSEFADDYYDYNGYGYGDSADGCLLVVNMETRDWYITTAGRIIDEIPSYVIDSIGESFVPYLSSGDYLDAFMTYGEIVDYYISETGEAPEDEFVFAGDEYAGYEGYYDNPDFNYVIDENGNVINLNKGEAFIKNLGIAVVIGIILAFITVSIMKGQLKSVRISTEAREYMKADTLSITKHSDRFLYRNVTRTARPKNNTSSGGGGVHVGSSGRSHGGGGGKF